MNCKMCGAREGKVGEFETGEEAIYFTSSTNKAYHLFETITGKIVLKEVL